MARDPEASAVRARDPGPRSRPAPLAEPGTRSGMRRSGGGLERARDAALLALALLTACLAYANFRGYVFEDAYITYRYAENLASGDGFVFNPGERVLGTTTPLFTLVLALAGLLGFDVPAAGTALSVASIAGVGLAGAWLLRRLGHPELGVVYALLVLWGGFATYSLTGMETSFYTLLLFAAALAGWRRRWVWTGLWLGLALLTRYDAVVFAGPLLAWLSWRELAAPGPRRLPRGPLLATGVASALLVPWLVFASVYFGSPLPNTLAAKQALLSIAQYLTASADMFALGLFSPFLLAAERVSTPLEGAAALAFLAPIPFQLRALARGGGNALVFLLHALGLWFGYAWIGSSVCSWHLVPGSCSLALVALLAWRGLLGRLRLGLPAVWGSLLLLGLSFVALPGNLRLQADSLRSSPSYLLRERGYEEMARWMRARGLLDLVLLSDEPGYFTHLTGCRVVDGQGLVTKGIRPGDDLSQIAAEHGVEALLATDGAPGFRRVCEMPRTLHLREDVYRARLADLLRIWLAPAAEPPAQLLAHPLEHDFEPGAAHGWHGEVAFIGKPGDFRFRGEPVRDAVLTTSEALTERRLAKLHSPPFRIDFDELTFRLGVGGEARASRGLRVELLVDGLPVLASEAPATAAGEMSEVRWPVHAWRGKRANVRLVDGSARGWLALDRLRSVRRVNALAFDDFEAPGHGPRWSTTFAPAPVACARTAEVLGLEFVLGQATASSLDTRGALSLVSAPFVVERDELAFVLQDFAGGRARVELRVEGQPVQAFTSEPDPALRALAWDLAPYRGREAVLSVHDADPDPLRGIGIDALVLSDRE